MPIAMNAYPYLRTAGAVLALLVALAASGCKGAKKNAKSNTDSTAVDPDGPSFLGMPVHDAKIKGDTLYLDVVYAGSFPRDDDFTLTWNGKVLESAPPQVTLELYDKSMMGPTSMAVQSVLKFSLADLKIPRPCTIYVGGLTVKYK